MVDLDAGLTTEEWDADLPVSPSLSLVQPLFVLAEADVPSAGSDAVPVSGFNSKIRDVADSSMRRISGTVNRGAERIADTLLIADTVRIEFVGKKWEATDAAATRVLHSTEEFAASKSKVVSETVTAQTE